MTEVRLLLGQSMDAVGVKGGAGDAVHHSKDPGPGAPAGEQDCAPPRHPVYQNRLTSGIPPLASLSGHPDGYGEPAASDIVYGDAAYGSRYNVAACACVGMVPGILHGISATVRGKGSGAAWGVSAKGWFGGGPEATRLDLLSREEKRENQTCWKAKIGYNMRWVAEGAFSISKRAFGERAAFPNGRTSSWRFGSRRPCTGGGTSR